MNTSSNHPHLSAGRLGRYLAAETPSARRRLITDAQREVPFRWYDEAGRVLSDFLVSGCNLSVLERARQQLLAVSMDEVEAQRVRLCLEALARFEATLPTLGLEGLGFQGFGVWGHADGKLSFGGVEVEVRPDAIIHTETKSGVGVGLLKLYFSKHEPLTEQAAEYTTTLMRTYVDRFLNHLGTPTPRLVRLVDVFAGRVYEAPRATARRLHDVEVACEEVAARWQH